MRSECDKGRNFRTSWSIASAAWWSIAFFFHLAKIFSITNSSFDRKLPEIMGFWSILPIASSAFLINSNLGRYFALLACLHAAAFNAIFDVRFLVTFNRLLFCKQLAANFAFKRFLFVLSYCLLHECGICRRELLYLP